jgi:CRP-like cAMP-binding protein
MTALSDIYVPMGPPAKMQTIRRKKSFEIKEAGAIVMDGLVVLETVDPNSDDWLVTAMYGPGEVLIPGPLIVDSGMGYRFYAEVTSIINITGISILQQRLEQVGPQAQALLSAAAERYRASLEETLEILRMKDSKQRAMAALARIARKINNSVIPFERQRLVSYTGLSDATCGRVLKKMEEENLIEPNNYDRSFKLNYDYKPIQ